MTILIIILAYVANVFLNRWLNKITTLEPVPESWIIPVFPTIGFIWVLIEDSKFFRPYSNWFTGKHWRK